MKKTLLFLLFFTGIAQAQIVNIPDANFKTRLLQANNTSYQIAKDSNGDYVAIDTNSDGEIQVSEALIIKFLQISSPQILDVTGLEAFVELTRLECTGTQITSLPLNNLVNLEFFLCAGNHSLATLNLSNLTTLEKAYCDYNNLSSINVAGLPNLHTLTFEDNLLTSVNLSGLTNLVELRCSRNQLTGLNLNGLSNLELLLCTANQIPTLDLSGLINLNDLSCSSNLLTSIDVSNCPDLFSFDCTGNSLTSLHVDNLVHLISLNCSNNLLTSLDFDNVPMLMYLYCSNNQLATLDLSNATNLRNLACNNNVLTVLDLNSNGNLNDVNFMTNPLEIVLMKNGHFQSYPTGIETGTGPIDIANTPVQFICADEFEIDYWRNIFQNNLLSTTYCTFNPGGNYNTITGAILFDANNNGCDSNDFSFPNTRININDGTIQESNFTMANGSYVFYTQGGNFNLTPSVENPAWFNFSPPNTNIAFANTNNNTVTQNFCLTANGIHPDVEIVIVPITSARPGFDALYEIIYKNKGNQVLSGNISFNYNDAVLDFVSASETPSFQNTGVLNWNYSNLMPFENRVITVTLNANGPMETPAVNIDDELSFVVTANPVLNDETPADNVFNYIQTVVGSLDPNDKQCLEGNTVALSKIGDYLHYVIRFENIGTATAENIVVKDMIDTAKFDIASLQVLNASGAVVTKITGNKVEFIFEDINLVSQGYGNVTFKIKTKASLADGDVVTNKADIFFDYNFPVATNVASTVFQSLGTDEFTTDASVLVYPNPAANHVSIKADSMIKSVQLFDVQGRILVNSQVQDSQMLLDVSHYPKAVYFLKILTEKGSKTEKIVKE